MYFRKSIFTELRQSSRNLRWVKLPVFYVGWQTHPWWKSHSKFDSSSKIAPRPHLKMNSVHCQCILNLLNCLIYCRTILHFCWRLPAPGSKDDDQNFLWIPSPRISPGTKVATNNIRIMPKSELGCCFLWKKLHYHPSPLFNGRWAVHLIDSLIH